MKTVLLLLFFVPLCAGAQSAAAYISKGNTAYLQLQFEQAENLYRQAVEASPGSYEARYNLGNALMQQKKFKAAIEQFEQVAAGANTGNASLKAAAYYNAGVSYSKQKDLPASIEAYKAALRINPADKEARENLQKALMEQRQQQQSAANKGGGGMNPKDADQKLKDLQQKEAELQRKMQQQIKGNGAGGGKDW